MCKVSLSTFPIYCNGAGRFRHWWVQDSGGNFAGMMFELLGGSIENWREDASQEAIQTGEPNSSHSMLPLWGPNPSLHWLWGQLQFVTCFPYIYLIYSMEKNSCSVLPFFDSEKFWLSSYSRLLKASREKTLWVVMGVSSLSCKLPSRLGEVS